MVEHDGMAEIWLSQNAAISPSLKGAENYQQWEISVMLQARAMQLVQHLTGETPYSTETVEHHNRLTCLIWGSLSSQIHSNLIAAGWKAAMPAPKLMEFIKSDCGFCNSDFAIINQLHQFSDSRNSDFPSIRSWLDHHQNLWYRINMFEKIPDIIWVAQTVKAVEDSMPQVHNAWKMKSYSKEGLKKENMLSYLLKEANRQAKDREAKLGPRKKTKAKTKTKTQNRNDTREVVILDCGCSIRPGRVIHAMDDCWILHPQKRPGAMKKQAKPTTTASPVKPPAESLSHSFCFFTNSHHETLSGDDDSSVWSVSE
ncbi:hypothetical protein E4U19_000421 [Claviceps sp. Clav32 group G5]|nr:hypothetical protein E4U19_000421 [Claviceps sp. Clav32 group G5]